MSWILPVWITLAVSVLLALKVKQWAEGRNEQKPESLDQVKKRIEQAMRAAMFLQDEDEREAAMAGLQAEYRRAIVRHASGTLNSCSDESQY